MDTQAARERATAIARGTRTFLTGTTNPPAPRPRWLRRGQVDLVEVADAILATICFLTSNSTLTNQNMLHGNPFYGGWLLLIAFAVSAPLVLRTRMPFTAWIASALSVLGTAIIIPPRSFGFVYLPTSLIVYLLCLYAVAVRCAPRIILSAAAVTVLAATVLDPRTAVGGLLLPAIPVLIGVVVRTRRSGKRQLAEQERKHSGERALLEERQRIARELHDVVAHHMSVIAIQAEAAPYKTDDPPPELVESFGDIRASALTGLTELRRLLGVLRTGTPSTAPQPGLDSLDALLDSARSGGVTVTAEVTGTPDAAGEPVLLPDGVDLSAYRILQEALSNAMRHAPGSEVIVRVAYRDDRLKLEVRDNGGTRTGPPADGDGGHGIIGMRERAAMLGGTLFAGPDGGGFRVTAVLPVSAGRDRREEPA